MCVCVCLCVCVACDTLDQLVVFLASFSQHCLCCDDYQHLQMGMITETDRERGKVHVIAVF